MSAFATSPIAAAIDAARAAGVPGWLPEDGVIERLRSMRTACRLARDLYDGKWREVLVESDKTQHLYRQMARGSMEQGIEAKTLVSRVNIVALAVDMHAAIIVGRGVKATASDDAQQQALEEIKDRCLFDGLLAGLATTAVRSGAAYAHVNVGADGVFISQLNEHMVYPMGPVAYDGQPPAIERRWIVERTDPTDSRRKIKYLRVERHRVVDVPGASIGRQAIVEQEAYRVESDEVLVDLGDSKAARRVPLTQVGVTAPDVVETGLRYPRVVQICRATEDGWPALLVSRSTLTMLDESAAALSRLSRAHGQHLAPKMRVPKAAIDSKTGNADTSRDNWYDPLKELEYIPQASVQLDAGLAYFERVLETALTELRMPASLVGLKINQGAQPQTYESRLMEASMTMIEAGKAPLIMGPAISRLLTVALVAESQLPGRFFAPAPVTAVLRPELPRTFSDRVAEQREALEAGLTSRSRAVAELHGERQVAAILAEIDADQDAQARHQQTASSDLGSAAARAAAGAAVSPVQEIEGGGAVGTSVQRAFGFLNGSELQALNRTLALAAAGQVSAAALVAVLTEVYGFAPDVARVIAGDQTGAKLAADSALQGLVGAEVKQ